MEVSLDSPAQTIGPEEYPMYVQDEAPLPEEVKPVLAKDIAQGAGSQLDSDQVDGINAYVDPTPNALVPLGTSGQFPAAVIPNGVGGLTLVETQAVSASSSVSFTGLSTSVFYILEFTYTQNTSDGDLYLRFNSDSGSNYRFGTTVQNSFDGGDAATNSSGTTQVSLSGLDILATKFVFGEISFRAHSEDTTIVGINAWLSYYYGTSDVARSHTGGFYDGSSALTSIQLIPSAGTVTGTFRLWRRN